MSQATQLNLELNSEKKQLNESRRYSRLKIDSGSLVEINFNSANSQSIYLLKGLVIDSSLGGCGIIVVNKNVDLLEEYKICYLKFPEVNQLALKTKIVWIKRIENDICRLGLEFIDEDVF